MAGNSDFPHVIAIKSFFYMSIGLNMNQLKKSLKSTREAIKKGMWHFRGVQSLASQGSVVAH